MLEDVTFAQLRTFACAARAGSFAKAAEQLDISQPAVSDQIKALEDRLGCRLFWRRRGTVPVLTVEGQEALESVDSLLTICNSLLARSRMSTEKILLRISAGPYLRESYLRPLIPEIYRAHPEVEIDLQPSVAPGDVLRLIENGELDLAILGLSEAMGSPPHTRLVCEVPLVVVAPPGTRARLAAGECTLEDFQFIFPGHRDVSARWARQCLRELGLKPRLPPIFIEFADSLARMVEAGQGIAHLMAYAVADKIAAGRLEILDIPLSPMRRFVARSPHAPDVAQDIESMFCAALSV